MKTYSIRLVCIFVLTALLASGAAPHAAVQALPAASPGALAEPPVPTLHPILSIKDIRKAIAYCTNKTALAKAAYPSFSDAQIQALIMETFVPSTNWAYTTPSIVYPYSPTTGGALLETAGWTLASGDTYRKKDGNELALSLTAGGSPQKAAYLPIFVEQMRACGIHILLNFQPDSWFYGETTGIQVRDFEIAANTSAQSVENPGSLFQYACTNIPEPENNWSGENYMGWCNGDATTALYLATEHQEWGQELRKPFYATFINYFAEDVPVLPLFAQPTTNPNLTIWEHLDFNHDTYMQSIEVRPTSAYTLNFTDFDGLQGSAAIPSGGVWNTIIFGYTPLVTNAYPPPAAHTAVRPFRLSAFQHGLPQQNYQFLLPITVTVRYTDQSVLNRNESAMGLFYWNGSAWQDAWSTCPIESRLKVLDTTQNWLQVNICHLTEFSLMAGPYKTYVPMLAR